MKTIPFLRCLNMKEAIDFYTNILDFKLKDPNASADDWVVDLVNGEAELGLTILEGDQKLGINVYVRVDEVDNLFKKYVSRGLVVPNRPESPVHNGPIDQSWGMREFYVNDPSGNTLRFGKIIDR
jgi:catechol 2,3-dioxygenase-like lactoylglutathione lyase family enzyme